MPSKSRPPRFQSIRQLIDRAGGAREPHTAYVRKPPHIHGEALRYLASGEGGKRTQRQIGGRLRASTHSAASLLNELFERGLIRFLWDDVVELTAAGHTEVKRTK